MNILAIDPGETTGYVRAVVTPNTPHIDVEITQYGEWTGMEELTRLLGLFVGIRYCVVEDYLIYPNRAMSHIGDRVYTAREIGRVEWICYYHRSMTELAGDVVFQMPSQAMQLWPNERMHMYIKRWPSKHIGDALRHLLTFVEHKDKDSKIVVKVPENDENWR